MSKRVPAEILFDSKFLRSGPDVLPQDRLPPVRLASAATIAREYPVVELSILLVLLPFCEGIDDEWMDGNRFLRGFSLTGPNNAAND